MARKVHKMEHSRHLKEVFKKQSLIHPRWPMEANFLNKEKDVAGRLSIHFWGDGWNKIEGICLLMSCLQTILTIALAAKPSDEYLDNFRLYYSSAFALVVWVRMNRCLRSHKVIGPFIAILGECVTAVTRFAFLFFEFYIPFTCAFWVIFGGNRKGTFIFSLIKFLCQIKGQTEFFSSQKVATSF